MYTCEGIDRATVILFSVLIFCSVQKKPSSESDSEDGQKLTTYFFYYLTYQARKLSDAEMFAPIVILVFPPLPPVSEMLYWSAPDGVPDT